MSTFFGLEIGKRALLTHQRALEVTSHNLSNAGTEGYSRQRAEITATEPYSYPSFSRSGTPGQVGTGVDVTEIKRIRDGLIDQQIQKQSSILGEAESRQDMLSQMETIMTEPTNSGIREASDKFWASLQELSIHPNEEATRSAVRQQAQVLTDQITHNYVQLKTLQSNANEQIKSMASQINTYADQIAQLNLQIGHVTTFGDNPNDLLDKRDLIVEKLSKLVNVTTYTDKLNRLNVSINGKPLVMDINSVHIQTVDNEAGMAKLQWADTLTVVQVNSGSLKGLMDIRDQGIPDLMTDLDTFAKGIIDQMNRIHRQGYGLDGSTNNDFFSGTGAENIDISDTIKTSLNKISASKTGAPGNGDIAREMADLKQVRIYSHETATMGDFFGGIISRLGIESAAAQTKSDNQGLLINNLNNKRESISGVSLDEEMTDMIKFQHGYTAASKIITTMDEMLDVIVNGLKR